LLSETPELARALRLLLKYVPDVAGTAGKALAAPISSGDAEGVQALLEAGADPRRFRDDDARPGSALHVAIAAGCPAELVELLVDLTLDLGFPIGARVGDDGGALLHAAAYAGSAEVVQLLLARGADLEACDSNWEATALSWAWIGSGERPTTNPKSDWPRTVQILLDAGTSTDGITFSPDDPKPPSREVADILRTHLSDSQESPA
jgi:hypothetical protein